MYHDQRVDYPDVIAVGTPRMFMQIRAAKSTIAVCTPVIDLAWSGLAFVGALYDAARSAPTASCC